MILNTMEILINLPSSLSINTYKELIGYLKQFELAIHHAQKAVENAEKTGVELTANCFTNFEHPSLDKDITDENYDELQNIQLRINLQ